MRCGVRPGGFSAAFALAITLVLSSATHAGDEGAADRAGFERWTGPAGERIVDVRDLGPDARIELERLLSDSGFRRLGDAREPAEALALREDLRALVEGRGRFPAGYRPAAGRGLPGIGEASVPPRPDPAAAVGAQHRLLLRAMTQATRLRIGARVLAAFGHRQPSPVAVRRIAVPGLPAGRSR